MPPDSHADEHADTIAPMRTLLVCLIVACGGSKPAPESVPEATSLLACDKVADHVAATLLATAEQPRASAAEVKDMVTTRCTADVWSDETKRCLHAITSIVDGRACGTTMTDAQREAIRTAARALRAANEQPPPDDHGDWVRHVVEEPTTTKP
jgi:hypothetical protein